jgi:hypothetical protein
MSNSISLAGLLPTPHGNATLIANSDLCRLTTCDLTLAHINYPPSIGGNALFAGIFAGYFLVQLLLGFKFRSWGFMATTTIGMMTEVIGYVARLMMHNNPFSRTDFLMYLVTLTIAPAFPGAAVYLCLARIIVVYGEERSRFRPRTYTIMFCSCDFLALLLQAAGGAIASTAQTTSTAGINIMLAGLSCQVASLVLFAACCGEFAFRINCSSHTPGNPYADPMERVSRPNAPSSIRSGTPLQTTLPKNPLFQAFFVGLCVATLTIFIRSCFRVAELSGGFYGPLANNEVSFMVLEGAMVATACLCLTILHPGVCFKGEWRAANFKLGKRTNAEGKMISISRSDSDSESGREPPEYSESIDDAASIISSRSAIVMTSVPVRPGQVHVEMVPVYGFRYENTSDEFPLPTV